MRYALLAAAIMGAGLLSQPAHADPYRWCAQYGGAFGGGSSNCYFMTLAQCRAAVSGVGGFCRQNMFYDGRPVRTPEDYAPGRRSKRR